MSGTEAEHFGCFLTGFMLQEAFQTGWSSGGQSGANYVEKTGFPKQSHLKSRIPETKPDGGLYFSQRRSLTKKSSKPGRSEHSVRMASFADIQIKI
ncbi:hypothetical protein K1W69_03060 [Hoeflea sp. WL0058]|uniref:Uncharacterized protein n=1 Tax=Flavimaribacter sediminis TaxID=2865987 RepID=A0AAE2ZGH9_9HYPH|nr:hypothetical protein [Flavimaribacter sediminis]